MHWWWRPTTERLPLLRLRLLLMLPLLRSPQTMPERCRRGCQRRRCEAAAATWLPSSASTMARAALRRSSGPATSTACNRRPERQKRSAVAEARPAERTLRCRSLSVCVCLYYLCMLKYEIGGGTRCDDARCWCKCFFFCGVAPGHAGLCVSLIQMSCQFSVR